MSDNDPQQDKNATMVSVVVGLVMIGFALWVVLGSGLFSPGSAPEARPQVSLAKALADEALGSVTDRPVVAKGAPAASAAPEDPLMVEILGQLKSETAV